jgi:hypothetical protein
MELKVFGSKEIDIKAESYLKNNQHKKGQVVECLPSRHKTLPEFKPQN